MRCLVCGRAFDRRCNTFQNMDKRGHLAVDMMLMMASDVKCSVLEGFFLISSARREMSSAIGK